MVTRFKVVPVDYLVQKPRTQQNTGICWVNNRDIRQFSTIDLVPDSQVIDGPGGLLSTNDPIFVSDGQARHGPIERQVGKLEEQTKQQEQASKRKYNSRPFTSRSEGMCCIDGGNCPNHCANNGPFCWTCYLQYGVCITRGCMNRIPYKQRLSRCRVCIDKTTPFYRD